MVLIDRIVKRPWLRACAIGAVLLILMAFGAAFRLGGLSRLSLMIDSIWIYMMCLQGTPAADMMRHWLQVGGAPSTIPFSTAFAAWVLQTFHIPVTIPSLIVPFTFWGILSIPLAYLLGREMAGVRLGFGLAILVAFNPTLIQISREPYFYSSALFGAFLVTWATLRVLRTLQSRRPVHILFHLVNALGVFVMAYSSPSAWSFLALCGLIQGFALLTFVVKYKKGFLQLVLLAATYVAMGLPLLLVDWGVSNIMQFTGGEVKDYWLKVFRGSSGAQLSQLLDVAIQVLWGKTVCRSLFVALVMTAGVIAACRGASRDRRWWAVLALVMVIVAANFVALKRSVWGVSIRYLAVIVPAYLLIAAAGLLWCVDLTSRIIARWGSKQGAAIPYLWLLLPLAFWLPPAYAVTQTTCQGFPYQAIVDYLDRLLPKNTPVFTDRFFTAYNEFRVHAPTNVMFVSVGPNQIREEYNGIRFRERAEAFLRANPVSVLYEEQHLWNDPEVGSWLWPQTFYANERTFTDHVSLWLTEIGLSLRGCGHRTVRYNLPRNIVARAIRQNIPVVALFGENWTVATTSDNRIWRCLGDKATIDVYNVTPSNVVAAIAIQGVAIGNAKTIRVKGASTSIFPPNMLVTRNAGTFRLPPGRSPVTVEDPEWSYRQTLLVADGAAAVQIMETLP